MESLFAVALVLVGWIVGTGLLVKVYQDGGSGPEQDRCEVVCRGAEKAHVNG